MVKFPAWRKRAEQIAAIQDPEDYHGKEDDFVAGILLEIASGRHSKKNCRILAKIALKLTDSVRERWYA